MENIKTITLQENDKLEVIYEINPLACGTVVCKDNKLLLPNCTYDLYILDGTNPLKVFILQENDVLEITAENNPKAKVTFTPKKYYLDVKEEN